MIDVQGETYYNASEAAKFLQIPRWMFYSNVKPRIIGQKLAVSPKLHYKRSDLVQFQRVEPVDIETSQLVYAK